MPPRPEDRFEFIDTDEGVAQLAARLEGAERIGLDTEFHSERRYEPELMLLQLALEDDRVWLIDPRSVDLRPLAPVLEAMEWVVHGAEFDVQILHRVCGVRPLRLCDTQIAAGMAGWLYPCGQGALASALLGLQVEKTTAMSNRARRPLLPEQLHYAAHDPVLALALADQLEGRLDEVRWGWVLEAGAELVEAALAPRNPDRAWLRLEVSAAFDEPTRRVLMGLYRWREGRAAEKGVPPHFALTDAFALDLARRRPASIADLRSNRRIPSGLIKRHGETLLNVIASSLVADMRVPEPLTPAERHLASTLQLWAQATAAVTDIAPPLALPDALAEEVARHGPRCVKGWRAVAVGDHLQRFLRGDQAVTIRDDKPVLVDL